MKTILKMSAYLIRAIVHLRCCAIQINELERDQNKRRRKSCQYQNEYTHGLIVCNTDSCWQLSTPFGFAPLDVSSYVQVMLFMNFVFLSFSTIYFMHFSFVLNFDREQEWKIIPFFHLPWKQTFAKIQFEYIFFFFFFGLCYCSALKFWSCATNIHL